MKFFNANDLIIPERRFRPELEGLRAVACLLVAIYHIWLGSVSGGVDVFFVVSGYLITMSLLGRMEREGRINFFEYLLGLARRLFPLAAIVLLFSGIFSFLLMPQTQWKQIISEIFASVFYFQNWQLATNAVDYLAQNNEASPLQHFWAMSIQGQFYIIWPLVIFIAFILAKHVFKMPNRKTLLIVLVTIFVFSLSYSIYITAVNQPWAYFDTFARMWEFSIGGILALLLPYVNFNKLFSMVLGWVGLAMIIFTGILLPVSTVFPGYAALFPITGVLFIIMAADQSSKYSSKYGVERLLGAKFPVYLGGLSYGFYLWHWPLLIFYYAYFGIDSISLQGGVFLLLVAFILSVFTTRVLEAPIRKLSVKQSQGKLVLILSILVIPVLLVNISWSMHADRTEAASQQQIDKESYPGAQVLRDDAKGAAEKEPDIQQTKSPYYDTTLPTFYGDKCYVDMNDRGMKVCSYGETNNPEYVIALVGGSRTGHWFPALEEFAEESRLRIDVYNKDSCRFSTEDFDGLLSDSCMEWNELVIEPLLENPPDLIFTTANVDKGDTTIPQGYMEMFEKFEGITKVFAILNNPTMPEDVPTCVETKGADECTRLRKDALAPVPPWENTKDLPAHVYFADLSDYLCDEELCYSVIGNVVIYRDRYHLSTAYARTLSEPLKEHILKVLEQ